MGILIDTQDFPCINTEDAILFLLLFSLISLQVHRMFQGGSWEDTT